MTAGAVRYAESRIAAVAADFVLGPRVLQLATHGVDCRHTSHGAFQ
jgi:hypothetical protein